MKIVLAKEIGFCSGVKNSVNLTKTVLKTDKKRIYMLGPIVHNLQVIEMFQKEGVKIVDSIEEIPEGSTVITRAHGVSPSILQEALTKKLNIIDTTCPYVKKAQEIAKYLNEEDYLVIIFGDKRHPEISNMLDIIHNNALMVDNIAEIREIKFQKKIGLLSQTTKNFSNFRELSSNLLDKTEELRIFNTICKATIKRQKNARELAKVVDIMLVIGGKESANTSRLVEICRQQGVKTYHLETKGQLEYTWFHPEDRVGITSGTSTPDWSINEIVEQLEKWQV